MSPKKTPKTIDLKQTALILKKSNRILITTHQSPDGDGLGSLLALAEALKKIGKQIFCYNSDPIPKMYSDLPGVKLIKSKLPKNQNFDLTVLLDTGELSRAGKDLQNFQNKGQSLAIDHHFKSSPDVDSLFSEPNSSSTGELVYDVIKTLKIPFSKSMAHNLFTSISTDTGSFRYQNATSKTFSKAAHLVSTGINIWKISEACFERLSPGKFELYKLSLSRMQTECNGRYCWFWLDESDYKKCGASFEDADGFINTARGIEGVEVCAFFKTVSANQTRVSLRSRHKINVAKLAYEFGGGGHKLASGFTFDGSFEDAKKALFQKIKILLPPC